MSIERRVMQDVEIRVTDEAKGQLLIRPVRYKAPDTYGTNWQPKVFNRYVESGRHTVTCWGHDWKDPIGHMVDYQDTRKGPETIHQLDLVAEVPRALQAWAQTRSKTIRDTSVGFNRVAGGWKTLDEPAEDGTLEEMYEAELPEVSLVVAGSVPGAVVTGTRSVAEMVDRESVSAMARALADGAMTLEQAEAILAAKDSRAALHEWRESVTQELPTTAPAVPDDATAQAIREARAKFAAIQYR